MTKTYQFGPYRLVSGVGMLMRDDLVMPARLRPKQDSGRKPRPGDYDHLARTDEWMLTSGVDDPPG